MSDPNDKENSSKAVEKNPKSAPGIRAALSNLENVLPPNTLNVRTTQKSTTKSRTIKTTSTETKIRSTSASEVETKVQFSIKKENITERQNGEFNIDEVFVEGEYHYLNYVKPEENKPKTKSEDLANKVEQNLPVVRVTAPTCERKVDLKKPAKKETLRRLSNRRKQTNLEELFRNCLYETEYFEGNFRYMLLQEGNHVYRKLILKKSIDENYRMLVINWLIYTQQVLELAENTFFVAVRMFDFVLASSKMTGNKYILVAITCIWIANKMFDVRLIHIPKLFALCNGKFSKQQFISTEREILKLLKFDVNIPEPTSFLFYFLKLENLELDSKICYSALFLLEILTLLLDFSSLPPSFLAAVAFYLILVKYELDTESLLERVDKYCLDKDLFKKKSEQLALCVEHLLQEKNVSSEIVAKYSTEMRGQVARNFLH
ncbi:G2/mitotic-specific cyclin CLB2-like isoform X2 [Tribolium madens]|uniref:G2/mitotic-specific cyclin CLB2-like isoform X2 n=1 Tax=Tribolium madens TaxID=41895 RepID=UPI001CF75E21|nr:G2/mitotic-specific cyclin CLB2-like isoform X2 [Tribolium madens]